MVEIYEFVIGERTYVLDLQNFIYMFQLLMFASFAINGFLFLLRRKRKLKII